MSPHGRPRVISIDGPAGAGKSSVSRRLAERLGWMHVDSGAMYRAFTWRLLETGISPDAVEEVGRAVETVAFDVRAVDGSLVTLVNGVDPGDEIRSPRVTSSVSAAAAHAGVRRRLVALQRSLVRFGGLVMEGRDIGTAVFPDAPWKYYLDASEKVRAERRRLETHRSPEDVLRSIRSRDRLDSSRPVSPLRPAADAVIIDTSTLSLDEVVDRITADLEVRGCPMPRGDGAAR